MNWREKIEKRSHAELVSALERFISDFTSPAFGALPKREIDLVVFCLLRELKLVDKKASAYDLMTTLKITRTRATQLVFDLEVRELGSDHSVLEHTIVDAVANTKFQRDGNYFVMQIENRLAQLYLQQRLRCLGHVTDTSFSSDIVRISLDAATDLITSLIPESKQSAVRKALIDAGAPDTSLKGVVKSSLKKLGSKVLGGAADKLVEDGTSDYLEPLLKGASSKLAKWKGVL